MSRSSPTSASAARFPRLCAIVDEECCRRAHQSPPSVAAAYLSGGARWLQLRVKSTGSAQMLDWAREIADRARAHEAIFVVNDRADVARLVGAGLHVGQDDLPVDAARRILGHDACLGLSTHTVQQAELALELPVSYVSVGPVFATTTKDTGYAAVGTALVREVVSRSASRTPVVGIGGITLDGVAAVFEAGAASVAVIGDLMRGDAAARCAAWIKRLDALP